MASLEIVIHGYEMQGFVCIKPIRIFKRK